MRIIDWLQTSPGAFVILVIFFGLFIGSFLNVVAYRLPIMLKRAWSRDCQELFSTQNEQNLKDLPDRFDLVLPRSRCPECGHQISAFENIPVLSYLFLQGKCSECKTKISIQYLSVEFITALLSAIVAWKFGWSTQTIGALLLTWALISLSVIDLKTKLLPDQITLPFLWLGVLFNVINTYTDLQSSVIGAVAGYTIFWLVFQLFKFVTKKEGMGYGDFKLLAMIGAWLGWQYLPIVILISATVGAIVGITFIVITKRSKDVPIPFGPYLAVAGWITLLWGPSIYNIYFKLL